MKKNICGPIKKSIRLKINNNSNIQDGTLLMNFTSMNADMIVSCSVKKKKNRDKNRLNT